MAKIYKTIALLFLIIILAPITLDATTYYVDKDHPSASDNNPGTENLPWKSIEKAVNTAIAGDIVIFKIASTDYMVNTNLSFPNSGSTGNHIVFKAFNSNEKPVWNWGGNNFRIQNKHYITIDGFVIKNMADGLYTRTGSSHIHIMNNHIIGQGNGGDGELVRITGINCLVSHNEIEKAGHNAVYLTSSSGDNITPNGTIIEYNYIHDNDYHHGINIFPVTFDNNPLHIDNIIIRYNRIETSDWGIYTRYMRAFNIYNNIIYNNQYGGIHLGGFDSDNSGAQNRNQPYDGLQAIVANNIIISALSNDDTGFENARVNNMLFINNILSSGFLEDISYYNKDNGPHPTTNQTIDYNIYDGGDVLWEGSTYGSPSEWFSAVPEHNGNSYDTDPLYITSGFDQRWNIPGSFELQSGSFAIDGGFNLNQFGIFDDYIQVSRPQGSNWDIGAFETISGPDVFPPWVIGAELLDSVTLKISFSEPLESSSAQNSNNYSITNGISVLSASLSGSQVILSTSVHSTGFFTVTVNNVEDLAGNLISPENNWADYNMIILPGPGFPVDLFDTPESEKTAYFYLTIPGNSPEFVTYHLNVFDADHGGSDPPEGHAFINGNGPIELFPGATQQNGDGETNEFEFIVPKSWWINGINELRFVRLYSTGYRINTGSVIFDGVSDVQSEDESPLKFTLEQNYPNPFNPSTTIKFLLAGDQNIKLIVFNSLGELIDVIADGFYAAGSYEISFDAENYPSGVYFYKLQTEHTFAIKKMLLLK